MTNFKRLLEQTLMERKSVMGMLSSKEKSKLIKVFNTTRPEKTMQGLDNTPLYDKVLTHLLAGRNSSVIPMSKTEGAWIVQQLEFDDKFIMAVREENTR